MPSFSPISVLMPVHNTARFVGAAIESILRQTHADLELIVCDDGSTDGSGEIARRMAEGDGRVRTLTLPRRGISAARNAGLAAASGRYVACLDSDDLAEPDRLAVQKEFLDAHAECVALGAQALWIDSDGDPLGVTDQPLEHEAIMRDLWRGLGSAILQPSLMLRREAVEKVGTYREDLEVSEDLDLYLRLAEIGKLANLPDRLIRFRRHGDSVSAVGNGIEERNPRRRILDEARRRRGLPPIDWPLEFPPHPATRAEWHAKWAFRALKNGYARTARKHAWRALRHGPLNPWALRAVARVVIVGRIRDVEKS